MKKALAAVLFLLISNVIPANPLPVPIDFVLSELTFDAEGNWVIEIRFRNEWNFWGTNGIYITTTTGMADLKQLTDEAIWQTGFVTITKDSLQSDLFINPAGDSISLLRIGGTEPLIPALVFGNAATATVRSPLVGESIALYDDVYSIDGSPSLGVENDSSGMCGTITGMVYDPHQLLPDDVWLAGCGLLDFKPATDGSYSARITSSKHTVDQLYYFSTRTEKSSGYYVKVVPLSVTTEPDTVVSGDLHVYDIVAALDPVNEQRESILQLSPNPVKGSAITYEIALPILSSKAHLDIFSLNGQRVGHTVLSDRKGTLQLHQELPNGTYTVSLYVNNKNYENVKLIVAH